MLNQYRAQRCKGGDNPHGIGTIPVGTILYIQDRLGRFDSPVRRNPWIVESWVNRATDRRDPVTGRYETAYIVGGHLAVVRSLRDGRRQIVADWHLLRAEDLDCEWAPRAIAPAPMPLPARAAYAARKAVAA